MTAALMEVHNGVALPVARVPAADFNAVRSAVLRRVDQGSRVCALFGQDAGGGGVWLWVVLARDEDGVLELARCRIEGDSYPSLTPDCPQVHWFERELAEQMGVRPEGHPWLKPIRFHPSWRPGHDAWGRTEKPVVGVTDFFRVEGEEVHEVAVGPVHAGVIEPGHFRFQCHGEHVFHLEISLGYQHRGAEKALLGGPHKRSLYQAETLAGDTTVGHTMAYCMALEGLSLSRPPARAEALRGIALELERLANHAGDLGALANDVGYLPTASFCGRIRGDFLNMTAVICGNRFGRGLVRPGGTGVDVDAAMVADLQARLRAADRDLRGAVELLFDTPGVMARFESTGTVTHDVAASIGLVGPAARASGLGRDVRRDHPQGIFQYAHIPVMTAHAGDVSSRALVRWLECGQSIEFIGEQLGRLPGSAVRTPLKPLSSDAVVVTLVEGWRGEVCHVAITDENGRFARYKVTDPSLHNWFGLALALRGEQISDFPLCNKSFNLSYCGHDL